MKYNAADWENQKPSAKATAWFLVRWLLSYFSLNDHGTSYFFRLNSTILFASGRLSFSYLVDSVSDRRAIHISFWNWFLRKTSVHPVSLCSKAKPEKRNSNKQPKKECLLLLQNYGFKGGLGWLLLKSSAEVQHVMLRPSLDIWETFRSYVEWPMAIWSIRPWYWWKESYVCEKETICPPKSAVEVVRRYT